VAPTPPGGPRPRRRCSVDQHRDNPNLSAQRGGNLRRDHSNIDR
jgi:hypothetical protein